MRREREEEEEEEEERERGRGERGGEKETKNSRRRVECSKIPGKVVWR